MKLHNIFKNIVVSATTQFPQYVGRAKGYIWQGFLGMW